MCCRFCGKPDRVYLIVGGQEVALHIRNKIGIETSPHKMRIDNFPPEIDVEDMTKVDIISFKDILQDTENEIKYKFTKKQLLLQALTNSSFKNDINDCNQRLVYLGEAIYQFFITRTIYENKNLSPYDLPKMRQPFLDKNFLGCIAVKLSLHRKVLTRNHQSLDNFLTSVMKMRISIISK